jgi:hypothetical protein
MGPSLAARRDRCRDNAARTAEFARWANEHATNTQNYTNQANKEMTDAKKYAWEADQYVSQMKTKSEAADQIISNLLLDIKNYAANIKLETTEEKDALKKMVTDANTEINSVRMKGKADAISAAWKQSIPWAKSANSNAYASITNTQPYAHDARSQAHESQKYADECHLTAYKRGDGGDDQRSNNDRNRSESAYNKAKNYDVSAKNVLDKEAKPKNTTAYSYRNDVNGKLTFVNNTYQELVTATNKSPVIEAIKKSMKEYEFDHSFDSIYKEIARIKPLKKVVDDRLPKDLEEEKVVKDKETEYNTELSNLLNKLKADKSTLADQTNVELANLEKELKLCTDKIDEYKKNIGLTNGRIAILSAQLVTEQTNLTNAENNKKTAIDKMNQAEKNYNDLSGQLIQLEKDKSALESLITLEEANYSQLQQYIEKLKKNIIQLNIEDYSSKIYNNQNLLNFNQGIDKDLENIFSDLKIQNINPDLLYTKTKYREIETEKLLNTDKLLDILFYCFYFAFIIIRIVTRNTKPEDFLIYIFIGLIPYVYPFIYKNSNYVIHLFDLKNKNAFIENETEISIDAYNI